MQCAIPDCRSDKDLKVCGRCKLVRYCCADHQRSDWPRHKPMCKISGGERKRVTYLCQHSTLALTQSAEEVLSKQKQIKKLLAQAEQKLDNQAAIEEIHDLLRQAEVLQYHLLPKDHFNFLLIRARTYIRAAGKAEDLNSSKMQLCLAYVDAADASRLKPEDVTVDVLLTKICYRLEDYAHTFEHGREAYKKCASGVAAGSGVLPSPATILANMNPERQEVLMEIMPMLGWAVTKLEQSESENQPAKRKKTAELSAMAATTSDPDQTLYGPSRLAVGKARTRLKEMTSKPNIQDLLLPMMPSKRSIRDEFEALREWTQQKLQSEKLQVQFSTDEKLGRELRATCDIKKGQVVYIESSPFAVTMQEHHCAWCLEILPAAPHKCSQPDCDELYCSSICEEGAFQAYHRAICGLSLKYLRDRARRGVTGSSKVSLLIARVMAYTMCHKDWPCSPLDIPEIRQLTGKSDMKFSPGTDQCGYPFFNSDYHRFTLVRDALNLRDNPYFNFTTFRFLQDRCSTNAYGVLRDTGDPDKYRCGFGSVVAIIGSLFNHSCVPNVTMLAHLHEAKHYKHTSRSGFKVVFLAEKDIKRNDPLTISYIEPVKDRNERAKCLMQYNFLCKCELCLKQPLSADLAAMLAF